MAAIQHQTPLHPSAPQHTIDTFWKDLSSDHPRIAHQLLPDPPSTILCGAQYNSYEAARAACVREVKQIKEECERSNRMYTDPGFDIESDFTELGSEGNCLRRLRPSRFPETVPVKLPNFNKLEASVDTLARCGLMHADTQAISLLQVHHLIKNIKRREQQQGPGSVHRVGWIFEAPNFVSGGPSCNVNDVLDELEAPGGWDGRSWLAVIRSHSMTSTFMSCLIIGLSFAVWSVPSATRSTVKSWLHLVRELLSYHSLTAIVHSAIDTFTVWSDVLLRSSMILVWIGTYRRTIWQRSLAIHAAALLLFAYLWLRYDPPYAAIEYTIQTLAFVELVRVTNSIRSIRAIRALLFRLCNYIASIALRPMLRSLPPSQLNLDYTASVVIQGAAGNCWWLSGIASLCSRNDLLRKVCVAWCQSCGVYGFVFHKDGQWVYTIIDDYLYLAEKDYGATIDAGYDATAEEAARYRTANQTGSEALYFSRCADDNQTWLPLLEKAYAKVHGDFSALDGGWVGDAVDDMSGGVCTQLRTNSIVNTEDLWRELRHINGEYVFSLVSQEEQDDNTAAVYYGIAPNHAFSVLGAIESRHPFQFWKKIRLLKVRNPWGRKDKHGGGNWQGAWSDGSPQWSPLWMLRLRRSFSNDGIFMMSFEDMLQNFQTIERTRLYDTSEWTLRQSWTTVDVPWIDSYNGSFFTITLRRASEIAIVLAQLDDRYFRGLEGRYIYRLGFTVRQQGPDVDRFVTCATSPDGEYGGRSVSIETTLDSGVYQVQIKVTARCRKGASGRGVWSIEDAMKLVARQRPWKLQQILRNLEAAHRRLGLAAPAPIQQLAGIQQGVGNQQAAGAQQQAGRQRIEGLEGDPAKVAWSAACGIGLKVFCQDPEVAIAVQH